MKIFRSCILALFTGLMLTLTTQFCSAQQIWGASAYQPGPTWYPYIIARGETRAVIENTPIEFRPYRPLHFYGNTVRRTYYNGSPIPAPNNVVRGTFTIFRR